MDVKRTGVVLKPNCARVLFRPFEQQDPQRSMRIVGRVMELSETESTRSWHRSLSSSGAATSD